MRSNLSFTTISASVVLAAAASLLEHISKEKGEELEELIQAAMGQRFFPWLKPRTREEAEQLVLKSAGQKIQSLFEEQERRASALFSLASIALATNKSAVIALSGPDAELLEEFLIDIILQQEQVQVA